VLVIGNNGDEAKELFSDLDEKKTQLKQRLMFKYSSFNFHEWKVKIHMQLTNKNFWGIDNGIEVEPTDLNKLIVWQSRDDKEKFIIGLARSDS
jgi:hypothetical protein